MILNWSEIINCPKSAQFKFNSGLCRFAQDQYNDHGLSLLWEGEVGQSVLCLPPGSKDRQCGDTSIRQYIDRSVLGRQHYTTRTFQTFKRD